MKQAFTNTSSGRYAGKPMALKAKKGAQMPVCKYGAACMYKSRHPKKGKSQQNEKVCTAFLAGICEFGKKCKDRHPGEEECNKLRAKFSSKMCLYGNSCRTEGCLYSHPASPAEMYTSNTVENATGQTTSSTFGYEPASTSATYDFNHTFYPGLNAYEPNQDTLNAGGVRELRPTAQEWTPSFQQQPAVPPAPGEVSWANTASAAPKVSFTQSASTGSYKVDARTPKKIKIPIELWLNEFERPMNAFNISDALQRFEYVNQPYSSQAKAEILNSLGVKVMDMHYQSKVSAQLVLDTHLPTYLEQSSKGCWVITGTGHSISANSHQKKSSGGVLFDCVLDYLRQEEYSFDIGLDGTGKSGAFMVHKGS